MSANSVNKWWIVTGVFTAVIIIAGGMAAWLRHEPGQPVEIYYSEEREWYGQVYIHGAVSNPGVYPFAENDSISELVKASGGTASGADISRLELFIPSDEEENSPQKVDINRAEEWLLESLPGIGGTLAGRIVDYRAENGPYRSTAEIMLVEGIGRDTYEKIKDLITVTD